MKRMVFCAGLVALSFLSASAQVSVELTQDQDQFLPGEALPLAVRVTNRSGQTLSLGAEDDWLTFSVQNREGGVVPKLGEVPVTGEFQLESSKVATKRVDLAPYFSFSQPGRYLVQATVKIRNWDHDITSPPRAFDVIEGAKLWEQEVGVPGTSGVSNSAPEVHKYILQQANYIRGQIRLYLRVVAPNGKNLRVISVGQMLSFSHPEPQTDKLSNLHLLYQSGPHTFSYLIYSPEGEMVGRQTYEFGNARPRLRVEEDGTVDVVGGLRRLMSSDFPPAVPALEPPPSPAAPPAGAGSTAK
jgi:hypothetical protein